MERWLQVTNPSTGDLYVTQSKPNAIPPIRQVNIPSGQSALINMSRGATIEIGGLVIGPMNDPISIEERAEIEARALNAVEATLEEAKSETQTIGGL